MGNKEKSELKEEFYSPHFMKRYLASERDVAVKEFRQFYGCSQEQAEGYLELWEPYTGQYISNYQEKPPKEPEESICLYDMQSGMESYWADYYFAEGATYFGGSGWAGIPPLFTEHIPTLAEVCAYGDEAVKQIRLKW